MKTIITLIIAAVSFSALADQCSYISKKHAKEGAELIMSAETVQLFCEPCGDVAPVEVEVKSVTSYDVDYEGYWQVSVNGKDVDLAYTFVDGINVSKYVECPSQLVSQTLD